MNQLQKESLRVRLVSVTFVVVALAIFKPFGLETWKWEASVHLLAIWLLGFSVCLTTEMLLTYVLRIPRPDGHDVSAIIHRNLWFQLINTPLVALVICLYRHFVMSSQIDGSSVQGKALLDKNILSWNNYIETLLCIAFCSFAIGLYWRFKYRSAYLSAELEETRQLNEKLKSLAQSQKTLSSPSPQPSQPNTLSAGRDEDATAVNSDTTKTDDASPSQEAAKPDATEPAKTVTLSGTTSETITLQIADLLYIETVGNYVKVYHLRDGHIRTDMLRATSKQMEDDLHAYSMIVRCHRAFLVNLQQVEQIVSKSGSMQLAIRHCHDAIPVSRSNMAQVKEAIKGM